MVVLLCVFLYILDKKIIRNTIKLSKIDKKDGEKCKKMVIVFLGGIQ